MSVNEKVNIFSNTMLNIPGNLQSTRNIKSDDKDTLWFNKKQKEKYKKVYRSNKSNTTLKSQVHLNSSIECAKDKFDNKIVKKSHDT